MFLFISGGEIFVILLVVVMVFGADKLPEIARELGKGMRQIKNATNDIKREIQNSADKNDIDIDIASKVRNEVNKIKDNFDDFSNPLKKVKTEIENSLNPIKDADENLVSYFNKPKAAKNSITDVSVPTEEVKDLAADSQEPAKDVKEVSPTKEIKDPTEEQNGSVKREK